MDSSRQILRYSIPGSVMLLVALLGGVFGELFSGRKLTAIATNATSGLVLGLVGLSVPLGFLLYQIYYFNYSPFTFVRRPTSDRGGEVLHLLTCEQRIELIRTLGVKIDARRATSQHRVFLKNIDWKKDPCPGGEVNCACINLEYQTGQTNVTGDYKHKWENNWNAVVLAVFEDSGSPSVRSEYICLSDIYHALGASRTAIAVGVILGDLIAGGRLYSGAASSWSVIFFLFGFHVIALLMYSVLHRARGKTIVSFTNRVGGGLRVAHLRKLASISLDNSKGVEKGSTSLKCVSEDQVAKESA
jgi:hypothetical protein